MEPTTNQQMRNEIDSLKKEVEKLTRLTLELSSDIRTRDAVDQLFRVFLIDRFSFDKTVEVRQALALDKDSTVGFFGVTPTTQQTAITTPSGGGGTTSDAIDITARTAIGQIKTALANVGITA